MRSWYRTLEGWEQASLTGAALAAGWLALVLLASLSGGAPSRGIALGAVALAAALYIVPLWVWGVRDVYGDWLDQPSDRQDGHEYVVKAAIAQLVLGGLEVGLTKLGASLAFLAGLAFSAVSSRPRRSRD